MQKAAEHAYINNHRIFNNPRRISKITSQKKKKKKKLTTLLMGSDELSEGEQFSFSSNPHLTRVLVGSNLSIITYEGRNYRNQTAKRFSNGVIFLSEKQIERR